MNNFRFCCFITIIIFISAFCNSSEAKHGKKLPSSIIVGTVYCDTCFQAQRSKPSHFIAGALVGVECKGRGSNLSFQKQVKTNANGKFIVHLPFSVSKHKNEIENCSIKLIKSSKPYCAIASSATQSSFHLKAKGTKTHIFSAGYFTFMPSNQPNLCNQKPTNIFNSRKTLPLISNKPSTVQIPLIPILAPTDQNLPPLLTLPRLPPLVHLPPLLQLPPLSTLPGFPILPLSDNKYVKQKTKIDIGKNEFPNDQGSRLNPLLSDENLVKQKTKNDLGEKEFSNGLELTANPQLPINLSPPPVSGFQFPPFSNIRPPSMNLPPYPFQVSPPVLPLQSPPVLMNPLPTIPSKPAPGLSGFPQAIKEMKKSP